MSEEEVVVEDARSAARHGRIAVRPVKTAYQQVADQLRSLVLSGELVPGDRLPVESELMELFGVSRSTVREALRVLSSQNLIVTSRGVGGGSFVTQPDADQVSEDLVAKIGLLTGVNHVSVDDLLEARSLLEVPAAGLAAHRRSPEHVAALEASAGVPGHPPQPALHTQFHRVVLEAAGNPLLALMTGPVFRVLRERFLRDAAPERFWHQVQTDHAAMIEAIRDGDAERAELLMAGHLDRLRDTYRTIERPPRVVD